YNIIYRLSICVLPLIVTPYVARVLGAEQVGIYAFSSTVALYFIMLGKLGLDNYGNRSIAVCQSDLEKRSKIFWGIYITQVVMSLLSILIFVLLVLTVFEENRIVYWMQLIYVASVLFDVSWFFYGMEKFLLTTIRSLVSRVLVIILVFAFVKTREDVWIYTLIMSCCFMIEQLQLLPFLIRQVKWVPLKKEDILRHIVPNMKLFIPLLALSIYNWMDKIMLGAIVKNTAVVAFYAYAENIINLPKGILTALDTVMLPRISNMAADNRPDEGIQKMRTSMRVNNFVSCALCFGIAGIAPVFIPWFLGAGYGPTIPLTITLAIVMIPMGIVNVIQTQYLVPFHLEHIYIRAVSLGALANIILNALLIPYYGAFGAVIGTLGAEILVCLYQILNIKEVYNFSMLFKTLLPFVTCGVVEFSVIYSLCRLRINTSALLFLQIFVGGLVYLVGCGIYAILFSKKYKGIKDVAEILKL
ncbi:MAG TPA: flippase, partial [Clostridia bacterium]|nr:flippase [Clostridia bacterium]